jgi:hypothetical protein
MANRKISDLTALTATATGDLLPIVDISEAGAVDQNKKITIQSLFQSIPVDVGIGEGTSGAGISIKNRLAALPTTGTNANIAWLESTSGFAAGSLLLGSRPSTGSVVLSANGAANLVVVPSTGNVGIGTSSPTYPLHVIVTPFSAGSQGAIRIGESSNGAAFGTDVGLGFESGTGVPFSYLATGSNGNSTLRINVAGTERARIDSSGRLLVGTSTSVGGSGILQAKGADTAQICLQANTTTSFHHQMGSWDTGSGSFAIVHSSGTGVQLIGSAANTWSSFSDVRLKDVTGTFDNAIASIKALEPIRFTWKTDKDKKPCVGLSAQSIQAVLPEAVDESPLFVDHDKAEADRDMYLTVRYTETIPLLTAALQEAIAKIETLEARLTAAGIA